LFGSTPATAFTVVDNNQLTTKVPPGPDGTVDVRIVTPGGESALAVGDHFAYLKPGLNKKGKPRIKHKGSKLLVFPGISETCPPGGSDCTGVTTATVGAKVKLKVVGAKKKKPHKAGKSSVTVKAGKKARLKFVLRGKVAKALARLGHLKLRVTVIARAGGGAPAKVVKTIKLKAPTKH
jgi:hypothetical protein